MQPELQRSQRILVVDDDPGARDWLEVFCGQLGFEVEAVASGEEAVAAFREDPPDLVTLDLMLPGMSGLDTLRVLKRIAPEVPVVMLSGHGQTQTIVEAVKNGARDFLKKPFEPEELELAFQQALSATGGRPPRNGTTSGTHAGPFLAGSSQRMARVLDVIDRVADTDITVLIRGESGTGKELIAQAIHERSGRRARPMVKVNCAALPSELLESELFGYEKGAFTGAEKRKLGKFEVANESTIFLDEISEMHPTLQAKLLQVLQDGQFSRLGGREDVAVDTRVLAATNRDLERAVREQRFREDLFYRLNVVTVCVPPLRERPDEIPRLLDHFLARYAAEFGKERRQASPRLHEAFLAYHWPGNVRELENLAKRLAVLGDEAPLLRELEARTVVERTRGDIEDRRGELERFIDGDAASVSLKRIARDAAQAAERQLIEKVLQHTRWNRKEAAEILQISYKALLYKMRDAGLADRV